MDAAPQASVRWRMPLCVHLTPEHAMPEMPSQQSGRTPTNPPSSPEVVNALEKNIEHFGKTMMFEGYMRKYMKDCLLSSEERRKLGTRHRSKLISSTGYKLLVIIWKESRYVS